MHDYKGYLLNAIKNANEPIMVTDIIMDLAFPAPKNLNSFEEKFKLMCLISNGNRPQETQKELIDWFCETNKVKYWNFLHHEKGLIHYFSQL